MGTVIIIEEFDATEKLINRAFQVVNREDVTFCVFSESDRLNVLKVFPHSSIELIKYSRFPYSLRKSIAKANNRRASAIVEEISGVLKDEKKRNFVRSITGTLALVSRRYHILKHQLKDFLEEKGIDHIVLVGKKAKLHYNDYFYGRKVLNPIYLDISALTKNLAQEKAIRFQHINSSENKLSIFTKTKIQHLAREIYRLVKGGFSIHVSSNTAHGKNKMTLLLRNKHQQKLGKKLLKNISAGELFIFNDDLMAKPSIGAPHDRLSFLKAFVKYRKFKMKELIRIGKVLRKHGYAAFYYTTLLYFFYPFYKLVLSKKYLAKKSNYYNFEETNFLSSIVSLALAAHAENSYSMQHGAIVAFESTMPLISNYRYVWGDFYKARYVDLGEDASRIVSKSDLLFQKSVYKGMPQTGNINVLLASEAKREHKIIIDQAKAIINELLTISRLGTISLSLHPNQVNAKSITEALKKEYGTNVEIYSSTSEELIQRTDVVITGNSTIGMDFIVEGKPILLYLDKGEHIFYDCLVHPYVNKIEDLKHLPDVFSKIQTEHDFYDEMLKDWYKQFLNHED